MRRKHFWILGLVLAAAAALDPLLPGSDKRPPRST